MEKNKTGKYLKYAIGEILLVVIGILIAIQLNEWRNDTVNSKQKQNVLKSLQAEFKSNISQLDTVLYYNAKILKAYPKVMEFIKSQDVNVEEEAFFEHVKNLGYTWSFDPINGALRSGISSGEIHLIKNDRLLELLFSWEDVVKDSEEEYQKILNHQVSSFPLLQKYFRIGDVWKSYFPGLIQSNFSSNYAGLIKDVLFEDYVTFCFIWATEYKTELNIIKTNNLEILALIDEELLK